jgi:signal transduction histidine kinase
MRIETVYRWLVVCAGVAGAAVVLLELGESFSFGGYLGAWVSAATALTALTAAVLLSAGPALHRFLPAAVAAGSVTVTLIGILAGRVSGDMTYFRWGDSGIGAWLVVEALALSALAVLAGRNAPNRRALWPTAIAALAAAAVPLRTAYIGDSHAVFVALKLCGWSAVIALGAVLLAGYLRAMDRRRSAAVSEARRAQRLGLASDLHDFAAHDVNGMVVQAQAAQLVAERDPQQALVALRRIEQAGLHALASMDQTVAALRAEHLPGSVPDGTELAPVAGIADLPALVERYAAAGPTAVQLDMPPDLADGLGHEASSTVYRVVVEALTNVRRHAPSARAVTISVRPVADSTAPSLVVTIVNDIGQSSQAGTRGKRGGHGLGGLAERVDAIGGTLEAGPLDGTPRRWRVSAVIPLSQPGA